VNDLVIASEERSVLWQALRERANQKQNYLVEPSDFVNLDPDVLAALLGFGGLGQES
jgi:hypothetical protein